MSTPTQHHSTRLRDTPALAMARKADHIRIAAEEPIESGTRPFTHFPYPPLALPEVDLDQIDLSRSFLGRRFGMPLLIAGMTGGIEQGQFINETLAQAAVRFNLPLGLGSLKLAIQRPELIRLFDVRPIAPSCFLIGNLGLVSFNYGITLEDVERIIDRLQLNAFAFHLNALQECVQPEGDRNFSGLFKFLETAVKRLQIPVMVKEVGCGISWPVAKTLASLGVRAIDLGGRGGTSWSAIEGYRGGTLTRRLGELFREWGLSTEESLIQCTAALGDSPASGGGPELIATGGIRDGIQVATACALGAQLAGTALPLFKAVVTPPEGLSPEEALHQELLFFQEGLRITLGCSGFKSVDALSDRLGSR